MIEDYDQLIKELINNESCDALENMTSLEIINLSKAFQKSKNRSVLPIKFAIKRNKMQVVQLLLKIVYDDNIYHPKLIEIYNVPLFTLSCQLGNLTLFFFLKENYKIDVNHIHKNMTPLRAAMLNHNESSHIIVTDYLLANDCRPLLPIPTTKLGKRVGLVDSFANNKLFNERLDNYITKFFEGK